MSFNALALGDFYGLRWFWKKRFFKLAPFVGIPIGDQPKSSPVGRYGCVLLKFGTPLMHFLTLETTHTRSEKRVHPIRTKQHPKNAFFPLHESSIRVSYPLILFPKQAPARPRSKICVRQRWNHPKKIWYFPLEWSCCLLTDLASEKGKKREGKERKAY